MYIIRLILYETVWFERGSNCIVVKTGVDGKLLLV